MLGGSFQIGRSALAAYQAAINVAGQNIANLGNPEYVRQSGRLVTERGGPVTGGVQPGGGVRMAQLRRHVDESLENRLRQSLGHRTAADIIHRSLAETEQAYNELTNADISTQLSEFFASFSQLETGPQDSSTRDLLLSKADALLNSIRQQRGGLVRQVESLNDEATAATEVVNNLAGQVADLNELIVQQEADGVTVASALRDRRDSVLREMAEYVNLNVREQRNGSVNVYIGSEPLVDFDRSRGLRVDIELEDGLEIASVRFNDDGAAANIAGGRLGGLLAARDTHVRDQLDRFDQLAQGLIYEVNRVHTQGVGLVGYGELRGEYVVRDPDVALNSTAAGLPFPVQNGTLVVNVRDTATGAITTRQIEVDLDGLNGDDTSLNDLAAALNGVPGLTASVTADGRLDLASGGGQEFWFSEDRSGALAALGVGVFFTGQTAGTIDVAQPIRSDVRRIAASLTGQTNDAANAGRMALLASSTAVSQLLSGRSIEDFHLDMVNDLAVTTNAAYTEFEAADAIFSGLTAQREAISGVSLDEEAINLTRYETAYQGAARYLTVLDELTQSVLALV